MSRCRIADVLAVIAALGVLVSGGFAVVAPAVENWGSVADENRFERRTVTETTTKRVPGKPDETTEKRNEAEASTKRFKLARLDIGPARLCVWPSRRAASTRGESLHCG